MLSPRPLRPAAFVLAATLFAAACSDDDASPAPTTTVAEETTTTTEAAETTTTTVATLEPLADQTPPAGGLNGLEMFDDTIWVASIDTDQVLQVDRVTGEILTRVDVGAGTDPDDVTIADDGTVYWTGFATGDLGRIVEGDSEVIANVGEGANPIGLTADGELIVGRAFAGDALYRVPLDDGEPELIAEPLGQMNAFVVEGDRVVGPVGGIGGPGGVSAVDLATGEITVLGADFPVGVTASDVDSAGVLHLLSFTGLVWRFDETTGEIEEAHALAGGLYDNLDFAPDGTLYVSHFAEAAFTAIAPDGTRTLVEVGSG